MSTNTLPQEPEWLVTSRKAAYCARRRLNGGADTLTPQDMEDMIQVATLAYWKHHREGRPVPFCFVCARQAVEKYFYRQVRGRNPRSPLSLDASLDDGGDLPHEWLIPSTSTDDTLRLDWLSDEVLEGVLFEARQVRLAPSFGPRMGKNKVDTDRLGQAPLVGSAPKHMIAQLVLAVKCRRSSHTLLRHSAPLPASGSPGSDAGARGCRTGSNRATPSPGLERNRSRRGRCVRT